jgi:hypothetical protein
MSGPAMTDQRIPPIEPSANAIPLSEDAIRPWNCRSWIFPRDPEFAQKAGRVLDLYHGRWEGELLHPGDYVCVLIRSRSIQARHRCHSTLPATAGGGLLVEHEYERGGGVLARRVGRPASQDL